MHIRMKSVEGLLISCSHDKYCKKLSNKESSFYVELRDGYGKTEHKKIAVNAVEKKVLVTTD